MGRGRYLEGPEVFSRAMEGIFRFRDSCNESCGAGDCELCSSGMAAIWTSRNESIEFDLGLIGGDLATGTLEMVFWRAAALASMSVRSLSHWGMLLCRKVKDFWMSEPDIATEAGEGVRWESGRPESETGRRGGEVRWQRRADSAFHNVSVVVEV